MKVPTESLKENILVVDDRPENLRLLSEILSKNNYKVRRVTSGKQAIAATEIDPPSIILLDIMMPDMNGYEVCQYLKSQERTAAIPVIFLSALDKTFDKVKAFEVGGSDYVTKPFQVEEIIMRVQNQLTILRQKNILKDQQKLLSEQNDQLKQEIADRQQIEIALAFAKEAAEEANRAKSSFLANMSHEIRTPMNGVLGMAQLLMMSDQTEQQQHYTKLIQESANALLSIINDILDFSKVEFGKLELEKRTFVLEESLKFVCNLLNQSAFDKGIQLAYSIQSNVPTTIIADEYRLRQILLNLVGNAIKFTTHGQVSISVSYLEKSEKSEGILQVAVADTGIGIPSDRLNQLFNPFTQADNSISRKYGGTGLGLAICKNLVALMGGDIWIESLGHFSDNAPSHAQHSSNLNTSGSIFHFAIAISLPTDNSTLSKKSNAFLGDLRLADTYPLLILLVEDNPMNQKLICLIMQKFGYDIDIANNGLEAIKLLETQTYDMLLMDVQMPEMDGLTATKWIRQNLAIQPYIVAITAGSSAIEREACLDAGMNDYISKPVDIKEIVRVIPKVSNQG
jgi:signal transduction histidine kinase/BarA-like signal transduction histidine kinase